jgi:hypothetical protein
MHRRFLLVFAAFATLIFSSLALAESRSVTLELEGLPENLPGKTAFRVFDVGTGMVTEQMVEDASTEAYIEATSPHSLVQATYVSPKPAQLFEGFLGITLKDETVTLPMRNLLASPSPFQTQAFKPLLKPQGNHTYYPPDKGKAVSYNPDDFTISGPGTWPKLAKGLAAAIDGTLVNSACDNPGDNSYIVVVSADPQARGYIEEELDLQQRPEFDPASRVKPHLIGATHVMNGSFTFTEDSITATVNLVDLATGKTVQTTTRTGKFGENLEGMFATLDQAAKDLSDEMCREKPWKGSLSAEVHKSTEIQNADPKKPNGRATLDVSITCSLDGTDMTCNGSYANTITGDGVAFTDSGSGSSEVGGSVGFNADGTFSVHIGSFSVPTKATLTTDGGTTTAEGSATIGGWQGRAKAMNGPNQSGTSKDPNDPDVTVTWSVSRN